METDNSFELHCHCGHCSNGATVTVVDGRVIATWDIGGFQGVTALTAQDLAATYVFAEFDFDGTEFWVSTLAVDALREWLAAHGVLVGEWTP